MARREHTTNKVKLQHVCYTDVRVRFGLSANLAIRAIARVCAALKVKSKAHSTFEPTSIDYDQRIFSFREWDWTFSLTLLHNRARFDATLGDYQKGRLKGHTPTSATLVKRRDGTFFLHVQFKKSRSRGTCPPQARWVLILADAVWPLIPMPRPMKLPRSTRYVLAIPKLGVRSKPKARKKPNDF